MSRAKKAKHRSLQPDLIYDSRLVSKLINRMMKSGKKETAQKAVYGALEQIKQKLPKEDALTVFRQAIENIKPAMEVRSRRVGGAAYQVPMPVKGLRRESLAIRWLVDYSRKRPSKDFHSFKEKLAAELMDAFHNQGEAVRKKEVTHKMAEANKAFAHFRW